MLFRVVFDYGRFSTLCHTKTLNVGLQCWCWSLVSRWVCFSTSRLPFLISSRWSFLLPLSAYGVTSHCHVCGATVHLPVSWWDLTGLLWWDGKRLRLSQALCSHLLWQRCQWWPDLSRVSQPLGVNISGISELLSTQPCAWNSGNSNSKTPEKFKVFWTEQMEVCVTKIWRWTPGFCINHADLVQWLACPIKPLSTTIVKFVIDSQQLSEKEKLYS